MSPTDFSDHGFLVIPKKGIQRGGILVEDKQIFCKNEFAKANTTKIIDKKYLITTLRDLVPSGPSIGLIVKYDNDRNYILAQGVYGFKIKDNFNRDFLIQVSNTDFYRQKMRMIFVGSTQIHIRTPDFFNVEISVPSLKEQGKIASILASFDSCILEKQQKLSQTKALKKALMNDLLTGKKRVKITTN